MNENNNVLILDFGDTGNEPEAIRQILEYFGYPVFKFNIGRPNDFIKILSGDAGEFFANYKYLVISCHGVGGKIAMPKLSEKVYLKGEPRNDFGASEIAKYLKIRDKIIINTGCATDKLTSVFARNSNFYIALSGYLNADIALVFVANLFYFLKNHDLAEAVDLAKKIDKNFETFKKGGKHDQNQTNLLTS